MAAVIFANCGVLDGTRRERREDHHVLVEGGQIREVSDRPISSATAETVDLKGRTLMPGLIDAHVHVIADQVLARLSERPVSLVTLQAARVLEGMLQRGFTTIRDAGGADGGLAEAVEEGLVRGPRTFPSGQALSQTGGHGDLRPRTRAVSVVACACCEGGAGLARIADGVAECRRAARDELRKGATQIKIMASGGVASPYDPVWNLQYSEEEVRAIVEEARAWHTYVMEHAYTPEAIRRSIDFGVRSIEHGNLIDRATAEHVAGAEAFVVPTLVTFDAMHRFGRELQEGGTNPICETVFSCQAGQRRRPLGSMCPRRFCSPGSTSEADQHARFMTAPSGTTSWVANRHKAIRSRRAIATPLLCACAAPCR